MTAASTAGSAAVCKANQPRPQGLLLDDFQNGGSSGRSAILKIVEEKALGTSKGTRLQGKYEALTCARLLTRRRERTVRRLSAKLALFKRDKYVKCQRIYLPRQCKMPHRDPKMDQVVLEVRVMKFLFIGE